MTFKRSVPGAIAEFRRIDGVPRNQSCFHYDAGRFNRAIPTDAMQAAAAQQGAVRRYSGCSGRDLLDAGLLRWELRHRRAAGGTDPTLRLARLRHPRCSLPHPADPYGLLLLFAAARHRVGGATPYPVVHIVGDSMHRGVFMALVAMVRGAADTPVFDRQVHTDVTYLVRATGDELHFGRDDAAARDAPGDVVLLVRFFGTFGGDGTPSMDTLTRPATVLVTGGLGHAEHTCSARPASAQPIAAFAARLCNASRAGVLPPIVVVRGSVLPSLLHPGNDRLFAYHSVKDHLYRSIAATTWRDGASASPRLHFLDDRQLANVGFEAPLDPALQTADGLHFTCTLRGRQILNASFVRPSCRAWHDRAVVTLIAAMAAGE